ncbi:Hydroxyquinol 1,2-dioxygenase [Rhodococcus fascians]|uniref:dioxygenase family protein n=1 Tax=Rhodococcoides fascians TaxID=1828 RepID=UPI00168EFC68|nr:Hydroxyquinol 1,2-dioxygenase [Rhodococcus fascians]
MSDPILRFSEERSAEIVAESFRACGSDRLRTVLESLVSHLHAFAEDVELSQADLDVGIDFLTRTGQACTDTRQEFVLLSDVLGLSMLVDSITNRAVGTGGTESTVLGPFHMVDSPPRELGATIAVVRGGEPTLVTGQVLSADGSPVAGAVVDVWQAGDDGFYDVQRDDVPVGHLRGLFAADGNGRFAFRTVLPSPYPIPDDGPVGALLAATGRHPYRPAHIHFIVGAAGHAPLTTHIFVEGSPYLDSDAVFGVKDSLVVDFVHVEVETEVQTAIELEHRLVPPYRHAHVEITLRVAS